ncbi:hypothetical protein AB1Y20_011952 [Prymnesium parvum]|uniref:Uncharacterized protein n=1 Tax=Prymnesium parvum TaxID=97485 RepID=A0AB34IQR3_PRYPA
MPAPPAPPAPPPPARARLSARAGSSPPSNAPPALLRLLLPRRGSSGEYSRALLQGTSVLLLISEVTGARHRHGERFLRACASAHAERYPPLDGAPFSASFYSLHSAFLSAASIRGLGSELRTRVISTTSTAPAAPRPTRRLPSPVSPPGSGPVSIANLPPHPRPPASLAPPLIRP